MSEIFSLEGYVTKISTMSKNTLRIQFDSMESVSPEAASRVFGWIDRLGHLLFAIRQIQPEDMLKIPESEKEFKDEKSPSKRMKSVYYLLWKNNPEGYEDFELYYRFYMEREINKLKSKLD